MIRMTFLLAPALMMACGSGDAGGPDTGVEGIADAGHVDLPQQDSGPVDMLDDTPPEVIYYELPAFDPGNYLDLKTQDPGVADPGAGDPGTVDPGEDTGSPVVHCRSMDDCTPDEICDFALQRCDPRSTWKDPYQALFSFHPPAGAAGDRIVIDGARFYTSFIGALAVKAYIGNQLLSGNWAVEVDENRIVAGVPAGASGPVKVVYEGGGTMTSAGSFGATATGVLACDGSTPGPGAPGTQPFSTGPHAAGYVDMDLHATRVFYPAQCGSIRRPAIPGTWPVVGLLHGNGALHMNLEYLGQLLATWGFVSFMPQSQGLNEYSQDVVDALHDVISTLRGSDLSSIHPALTGVTTMTDIAFVGHSKGCARMQHVLGWDGDLKAHTKATAFLGPADDGDVMPGLFLVIGAGHDGQSFAMFTEDAYDRQPPPRWKVFMPGGNHGSFCDHKVYYMFDGQPDITRHQQLRTVMSFVVPLMQRAFGQAEPFATQLDSPPPSAIYDVEFQLN
ncbi:MAG: hypothetical protein ISR64_02655 [Deltaproteobacteria bacterium]|nr:hypothetical protein [Deltaproteobacteria bacterium]